MIHFNGNFRLALDDVKIRDQITVRIDEKSRTQTSGRADLHDRLADLLDEVLHVAGGRGAVVRIKKLRDGVDADDQVGCGWRLGGRGVAELEMVAMTLRGTTSTV